MVIRKRTERPWCPSLVFFCDSYNSLISGVVKTRIAIIMAALHILFKMRDS